MGITFKKQTELAGTQVILKKYDFSHIRKMFEKLNSSQVLNNLTIDIDDFDDFRKYSIFIINQWKLNQNFTYSIIISEQNGMEIPIGQISVYNLSFTHLRGEIGIWIAQDYQNRGFGFDALNELVKYAFNDLHLNRLHCHIFTENTCSVSLFEKIGFQCEGTIRQYVLKNKKFYDVLSYSLLKDEWKSI